MARIKSALEIALERTKDIEIDAEKISRDRLITEGRRLSGGFLSDITRKSEDFLSAYEAYPSSAKAAVREGVLTTLLSNISLPQADQHDASADRLRTLIVALAGEKPEAMGLFDQIIGFYNQYITVQKELLDRLKQQYQPTLEQRQAAMRKQYGSNFTLKAEQDPDFIKLLERNYKQLDAQYGQALDQAKTQLKELLG
ncbi:DUF6657 family protein [Parasphaerochaeta coccoides]|uniref:Uncharacterized protein n=1 Tax=Parasphaerochaeta coccoides (strain ATCC BAA-1237 / DSM 17374 / SPN1) TaxID=760011 RepID=F4GM35_PARC1|nr:DUF6657 family protein [Parasphaerochaeta coccoides]AEC02510.1 hypothetical protein Spico_1302 [Parasphaerochaeta coccoides DSM 17374]